MYDLSSVASGGGVSVRIFTWGGGDAGIAIDIESLCNSIEQCLINPPSLITFYSLPVLAGGGQGGRGADEIMKKTLKFIEKT